jgi:hypothetical protein
MRKATKAIRKRRGLKRMAAAAMAAKASPERPNTRGGRRMRGEPQVGQALGWSVI